MANHKSAIKAHRLHTARRTRNRELRTRLRHALKATRTAIDSGTADADSLQASMRQTVSLIDKLVHKGVIHANAAARYKARLVQRQRRASAAA